MSGISATHTCGGVGKGEQEQKKETTNDFSGIATVSQ